MSLARPDALSADSPTPNADMISTRLVPLRSAAAVIAFTAFSLNPFGLALLSPSMLTTASEPRITSASSPGSRTSPSTVLSPSRGASLLARRTYATTSLPAASASSTNNPPVEPVAPSTKNLIGFYLP